MRTEHYLPSTPPSGPASDEDDEPVSRPHKRRRPNIENDLNDIYDPANEDNEVPLPLPKRRRPPRIVPAEEEEEVEEDEDKEDEGEEGQRERYRNRRCKLRDRFVTSIETALDPANYRRLRPPDSEVVYKVQMTADPDNHVPAGEVTWTNIPPLQTARQAAEDVVYQSKFDL